MGKQNPIVKFAGLSTAAAVLAVLCATGVIKVDPPADNVRVEQTANQAQSPESESPRAREPKAQSPEPEQNTALRPPPSAASKQAAVIYRSPAAPAAVAKQDTVSEQKSRAEETRPVPAGTYHGSGTVIKLLADDLEPPCHQRFLLKLPDGDTLLVTHNIDLAPRINTLHTGDKVEFCGEFFDNDKGGGVHWTHKDPRGRHKAGWLKHNGKIYE